jgi:cytochrome P450
VPGHLVVDFDMYNLPGSADDVQLAYYAFQQKGPDIFWTPRNGGHWVITRTDDIRAVQTDHERFSHEPAISIPPVYSDERNYPLQVDPPRHRAWRDPLVRAFQPRVIEAMAPKVRATTLELIEAFRHRGHCEFISEFGEIFPIVIFLDLVALPRTDRPHLLQLTRQAIRGHTVEIKMKAFQGVSDYLLPWVEKRRAAPGDDLISLMVNTEIDGKRIPVADAVTFARTVLLGGLDTVTAMLAFFTRFFATHPAHQRMFRERMEDSAFVRRAVEELMRRHGIVNTTRVITHDFEYKGVPFRKGDMVVMPNVLVGLDDRHIANPLDVDFDRPTPAPHAVFDFGPHVCVGAALARSELRIFLKEWFGQIPPFTLKPGTKPVLAGGTVSAVLEMHLAWDPN